MEAGQTVDDPFEVLIGTFPGPDEADHDDIYAWAL